MGAPPPALPPSVQVKVHPPPARRDRTTPQPQLPPSNAPSRNKTVRTSRVQPSGGDAATSGGFQTAIKFKLIEDELRNRLATRLGVFRKLALALERTTDELPEGAQKIYATTFTNKFLDEMERELLSGDGQNPQKSGKPVSRRTATSGGPVASDNQAKTYASVAATNKSTPAPAFSGPKGGVTQKQTTGQKEDLRVLIRLDPNSPAWGKTGFAIRGLVCTTLGLGAEKVPTAKVTATGWSLTTTDLVTRDLILNQKAKFLPVLGALDADRSVRWSTYVVAGCPRQIKDYDGNIENMDAAYKAEVLSQTGVKPVDVHPSKLPGNRTEDYGSVIVSFEKPISHSWRLFGVSQPARLIKKKSPLTQCTRCWDFHSTINCVRAVACAKCGSRDHTRDDCEAAARCAGCLGPHAADFPSCPARPKWENGAWKRLTKAERGKVRQVGAELRLAQGGRGRSSMPTPAPPAAPAGAPARVSTPPPVDLPDVNMASGTPEQTPTRPTKRTKSSEPPRQGNKDRSDSVTSLSRRGAVRDPSTHRPVPGSFK